MKKQSWQVKKSWNVPALPAICLSILSLTITALKMSQRSHRIPSHCQGTQICTQRLDKYDGNVWDSKQFIERAEPSTWITWVPRFMHIYHPELRQMQLKCMYWQQVVLTKVFVLEMSWAPSFMTIIKASGAPMRKSTGTSGALKAAWPYALRALAAVFQDPKTKKNGRHLNSDDSMMCFFNMSHNKHHNKTLKNNFQLHGLHLIHRDFLLAA